MRQVIVIGGGVIGLTSAWWLLEAGYRVRLLERGALAGGASHANGGQLSYRYVAPLADAGVPLKALTWLLQAHGPLRFRPEADRRQWRWLAQFLRLCNADSNRRTTATLLRLGELSRQSLAQLSPLLPPADFAWRAPGKLVVYRSRAAFARAVALAVAQAAVRDGTGPGTGTGMAEAEAGGPRGDGDQVLTAAEAVQCEPALSTMQASLAGAIYTAGEAVADCHAFCLALARQVAAHPRCDGVLTGEVHRLIAERDRIAALDTSLGRLQADDYVLAAGIGSRDLAASAGLYLPLYPLKGYSLDAPIRAGDRAPAVSVTDFERKVLYARIGERLRVAAMVDLVGDDARIDPRRIASLRHLAEAAMPDGADYASATPWAGLRPATPGGAPIVGATPLSGLWLNVGHGALGFTFACGTASLLALRMRGLPAPFPVSDMAFGNGLAPRQA